MTNYSNSLNEGLDRLSRICGAKMIGVSLSISNTNADILNWRFYRKACSTVHTVEVRFIAQRVLWNFYPLCCSYFHWVHSSVCCDTFKYLNLLPSMAPFPVYMKNLHRWTSHLERYDWMWQSARQILQCYTTKPPAC